MTLHGNVNWVEVTPAHIPMGTEFITLLGAGRDLVGAFHPMSLRQLVCEFNFTGGSPIGRTYGQGRTSAMNGEDQMYYEVLCPLPTYAYPAPSDIAVSLLYKGAPMGFSGPVSVCIYDRYHSQ